MPDLVVGCKSYLSRNPQSPHHSARSGRRKTTPASPRHRRASPSVSITTGLATVRQRERGSRISPRRDDLDAQRIDATRSDRPDAPCGRIQKTHRRETQSKVSRSSNERTLSDGQQSLPIDLARKTTE